MTYWLVDGNVIPDGWLKMDGQMHEVEHYPELARVLGRSHSWPGDPRARSGCQTTDDTGSAMPPMSCSVGSSARLPRTTNALRELSANLRQSGFCSFIGPVRRSVRRLAVA